MPGGARVAPPGFSNREGVSIMVQNLLVQFIKKALYGIIGNVGGMLALGATAYAPSGDPWAIYFWQSIAVGMISGAAGALKRFASFDAAKVGR